MSAMVEQNIDFWVRYVFDLNKLIPLHHALSLALQTDIFSLSWTQSPRVTLFAEHGELRIPTELLRARSPYFRRTIDELPRERGAAALVLHGVSLRTLKMFYCWSLSAKPSIPGEATQEELEELAYFAEAYQVFALEHQVADRFNDALMCGSTDRANVNIESRRSNLQVDLVSRVYQKCGPASCLRRVFQAALKKVGSERILDEWEEWSKLAAAGGELGIDLLKAVAENLPSRQVFHFVGSEDPCNFHNHERQNLAAGIKSGTGVFGQNECPFREVECFPCGFTKEGIPGGLGLRPKMSKRERRERKERALFEDSEPGEIPPGGISEDRASRTCARTRSGLRRGCL